MVKIWQKMVNVVFECPQSNSNSNNQDHDRSLGKIHENAELLRQVLRYNSCVLAAYQCLC